MKGVLSMEEMVQVAARMDKKTKEQAENVFEELGLNGSTAIKMFYKQVIKQNGIPFKVTNETPNERLQRAIDHDEGDVVFKNLDDAMNYLND